MAARRLPRSNGCLAARLTPDWDPRMLEESIDRSLKRLRTDYVDLIHLHSCPEEIVKQGAVIEVLQKARRAGKTAISATAATMKPRSTPFAAER